MRVFTCQSADSRQLLLSVTLLVNITWFLQYKHLTIIKKYFHLDQCDKVKNKLYNLNNFVWALKCCNVFKAGASR